MSDRAALEELARHFRVQPHHWDGLGRHQVCSDASLLRVLGALGAGVERLEDVPDALERRRLAEWSRVLEPVFVSFGEAAPHLRVQLPEERWNGPYRVTYELEDGSERTTEGRLEELERAATGHPGGRPFEARWLPRVGTLPHGYHRVRLELGEEAHEARLIAAPLQAWVPESTRAWGVFLPLYALHSGRSDGGGDLTDLEALIDWVGGLGGGVVGTLPLLATFLDHPYEPSPYAPVSRLFWNELFLDPHRVPELARCPEAQRILESDAYRAEAEALRSLDEVDYRRQMALRRSVLEPLAECAFAEGDPSGLEEFIAHHPRAVDYARFRAATETRGEVWHFWPERLRAGELATGDWDEKRFRYHLWVQLRTTEQIDAVCDRARDRGLGMYLDMPLGVHPDGFDAWRERGRFLQGCAAGAPPDGLFSEGQDWGFAPLSPEGARQDGYRYLIDCLRHQMAHAGVLRIDHVMGLHRIYCVPHGMGAKEGVYVQYPAEEAYAILTLESQRQRTMLVGEDLGTVPDEVREAMHRHGLHRMYVLPFETQPHEHPPLRPVAGDAVASVDTHDTPTFESFFAGNDVATRVEMGLVDPSQAEGEREGRRHALARLAEHLGTPPDHGAVLRRALEELASSDTRLLLINLEDLWLEPRPQNVPGTSFAERPNFRRKAAYPLERVEEMGEVVDTLRTVDARREEAEFRAG